MLQAEKPLSFREKKMVERARHMLVSEISIAREGFRRRMRKALCAQALAKSNIPLPAAA